MLDGVHIYKYGPRRRPGLAGFVVEFVYSWLRTACLSIRVWRRQRFTIMQACNPPDTYWAARSAVAAGAASRSSSTTTT